MRNRLLGEEHSITVKAVALLAETGSQANTDTSGSESTQEGEFYLL